MSAAAPAKKPRLVRFGDFEANLERQELFKAGARLRLPNQAFLILEVLIEREGELVTRESLKARLWPGNTFGDFEHGLNVIVNKLREVLGDSARNPRYVATIPRQGYRLLVPLVRVVPRTPEPGPQPVSAKPIDLPPRRSWRLHLVAVAGLILLVIFRMLVAVRCAPPPH